MWSGTAESAVELHPPGTYSSSGAAAWGTQQGGSVRLAVQTGSHAALWSGSAASWQDLHPLGSFAESQIGGMAEGQQVGVARRVGQNDHAAMWSGSAASHVDMHPPGAGVSVLRATCGSAQVGWANTSAWGGTAGIWFGTAHSFVPLAQYLPAGYRDSFAMAVEFHDGMYTVGGYAVNIATGQQEAFLWRGIPSPGAGLTVLLGAGLMAARRRR